MDVAVGRQALRTAAAHTVGKLGSILQLGIRLLPFVLNLNKSVFLRILLQGV